MSEGRVKEGEKARQTKAVMFTQQYRILDKTCSTTTISLTCRGGLHTA